MATAQFEQFEEMIHQMNMDVIERNSLMCMKHGFDYKDECSSISSVYDELNDLKAENARLRQKVKTLKKRVYGKPKLPKGVKKVTGGWVFEPLAPKLSDARRRYLDAWGL